MQPSETFLRLRPRQAQGKLMTMSSGLNHLVRAAGLGALFIGLALWTGRLHEVLGLHMGLGIVVVLCLWTLAILALRRGKSRKLATLALIWGVATVVLGLTQTGLLPGQWHWVVRVVHLLLGVAAVALAAGLARSLRPGRTADRRQDRGQRARA